MNAKLFGRVALLCGGIISASPAWADIIYAVIPSNIPVRPGTNSVDSGYIITDGTLGTISPVNILGWNFTITTINFGFVSTQSFDSGSGSVASGDTLTATLNDLWFPPESDSFFFGGGSTYGYSRPCSSPCVREFIAGGQSVITGLATEPVTIHIATNGVSVTPVPGPVVGAGLPGVVIAAVGLLAWWRRRARLT